MKRTILSVFLVLTVPAVCNAAGYVFATFGNGGEVDSPSYGLELGGIFLSPYHPTGGAFSLGVGVSVADSDENPPAVPDKKYNDGSEQEVFASAGVEIVPALFGVAGVGYSSQDVVKPSDTASRESDTDKHVTASLGVRYVVKNLAFGVGFHSRRGIMAGVGVAF